MKKSLYYLYSLCICLVSFSLTTYSQVSICQRSPQTLSSNTTTTIDVLFPTVTPPAGAYPITVKYGPDDLSYTSNDYPNATIASITNGFRIRLNGTPNLPTGAATMGAFKVLISNLYTLWQNFGTCVAPLPITLKSFTATNLNTGYTKLEWVTSLESNSSHFIVQRSRDGNSWENHGIEAAAGTTSIEQKYGFTTPTSNALDANKKALQYYYRLQMVDKDGTYKYSDVLKVGGTGTSNPTTLGNYPNIEGSASICGGPSIYKVHNGYPFVNWTVNGSAVSATNGGAQISLTSCTPGNTSIQATSTYGSFTSSPSKTVAVCSGGSIDGPSTFCTTANETLLNAPAGAVITWSANPTGVVSIGCPNCSTTTLTKTGSGQVTLSASVAGACASTPLASKVLSVGSISDLTGSYSTSSGTKTLQTVNFVPVGNVYTQFQWPNVTNITSTMVSGNPSTTGFYGYGNMFSFNIGAYQNVQINISGKGSCGDLLSVTRAFAQNSFSAYAMQASPNPAKSTINLAITTVPDTSTTAIASAPSVQQPNSAAAHTKLYLYDFNSNALVKQWSYQEASAATYSLNIAGIKPGVYVLKMERNNKTTTTKIIVQ